MKSAPNICWHKASSKWCAYGSFMGNQKHLGLYATEQEALAAVQEFKKHHDIEDIESAPMLNRVIYSNGLLFWRQHGRGHLKNSVVGSIDKKSGYRFVRDGGKKAYVHRLVWAMHFGEMPDGMEIDHINGVRDDNRIENLRLVTHSENMKNKRGLPKNQTGYRGVKKLSDNKFLARVWSGGSQIEIGIFPTAKEAGDARIKAEPNYGYHENHGRK